MIIKSLWSKQQRVCRRTSETSTYERCQHAEGYMWRLQSFVCKPADICTKHAVREKQSHHCSDGPIDVRPEVNDKSCDSSWDISLKPHGGCQGHNLNIVIM